MSRASTRLSCLRKTPTRRLRFLTSDRLLGTRATLKASTSTDLQTLRTRTSSDLTRALTRLLDFWLLLHAPVTEHAPDTRRTQLLMSSNDVISPRHQPRKHVHVSKSHVSPSPRQRHVIG